MECCNSVKLINADKKITEEEIKDIFKEICKVIINIKYNITIIYNS